MPYSRFTFTRASSSEFPCAISRNYNNLSDLIYHKNASIRMFNRTTTGWHMGSIYGGHSLQPLRSTSWYSQQRRRRIRQNWVSESKCVCVYIDGCSGRPHPLGLTSGLQYRYVRTRSSVYIGTLHYLYYAVGSASRNVSGINTGLLRYIWDWVSPLCM